MTDPAMTLQGDIVTRLRARALARLSLKKPSLRDMADAKLDEDAAAEIEALRAESSTHLLSIIADIREASGVGTKPMLSELAEAIRRTNQGVER